MKKEITTAAGTTINCEIKGYTFDLAFVSSKVGAVVVSGATFDRRTANQLVGWGKIKGKSTFIKIAITATTAAELKADQATVKADEKAEFARSVPGYDILCSLIGEEAGEWEKNRESIENDVVLCAPKTTLEDVAAAKKEYPVAAAYLRAERFERAANFRKSGAGSRAKARILKGENHEKALAEMEKEWSAAASAAVSNS